MEKLQTLFEQLEIAIKEMSKQVREIKAEIAKELSKQWDANTQLQKDLKALKNCEGVKYCTNEYGDVQAWIKCFELGDVEVSNREYFEEYLSDRCIYADFLHEVLQLNLGREELIINVDGRRHDRGIYYNGKQIISEKEYMEADEVNEVLRNSLIEAWMEKNGMFPGVFEASRHDNCLFLVNTRKSQNLEIKES